MELNKIILISNLHCMNNIYIYIYSGGTRRKVERCSLKKLKISFEDLLKKN